MAAATAVAGGPFARADEVKRLQSQVDQMKERLDFISPMLPLVNFVQDYFQRVECEAQVQLMRLKNAQVMQGRVEESEEGMSNAPLDTVKWIHFMTDAIMSDHRGDSRAPPSTAPIQHVRSWTDNAATPSPGLRAAFPSLGPVDEADVGSSGRVGTQVRLTADVDLSTRHRRMSGESGSGDRRSNATPTLATRLGGYDPTTDGQPDSPSRQASRSGGMLSILTPSAGRARSDEVSRQESRQEQTLMGTSLLSAMAPGGVNQTLTATPVAKAPQTGSLRPTSEPTYTEEPLAEPGTGGTNERGQLDGIAMTGSGGLIMGRGSWATAYRQASGNRREALRLLCTSGIVTARELSDDLTVISEEHIEECVQIATEMLQTWTLEMWARQPQEAKKFFEARLTALYQRKFGEQKGT